MKGEILSTQIIEMQDELNEKIQKTVLENFYWIQGERQLEFLIEIFGNFKFKPVPYFLEHHHERDPSVSAMKLRFMDAGHLFQGELLNILI